MKTANYLYPVRQNGAWTVFFAHRLVSIAATDLVQEDAYQGFVARILRAHADFLNSLAYARDERTFELRYISRPHPHVPDKGRIDIAFVGKVEHPQRREAVRRGQAFCEDTWMLLTTSFEEYEFARIENRDDFTALFRPMNYTHMAELLRREDCIPLEAIGHPRRLKGVGFLPVAGDSAPPPAGGEKVYFVFPFLPGPANLSRLLDRLLLHSEPCLVSICLKPTVLLPTEEKALEERMAACEKYHQLSVEKAADPAQAIPPLHLQAETLRSLCLQQLLQLQDDPFLMKIQLASPGPIPQGLLDALGVDITRPPGSGEEEEMADYFSGGYDWFRPGKAPEKQQMRTHLQRFTLASAAPTQAPAGLERLRYLFSSKEAVAAFRLPPPPRDELAGVTIQYARTEPAPPSLAEKGLVLGENVHRSVRQLVHIQQEDRRRHLYVVGQTGTGKSTLFEKLILQDIRAGRGLCVVDPHGDLAEGLLRKMPPERLEEVIYFNPSDFEHPLGLNILEWETEAEKHFLVQEVVNILIKLFDPNQQGITGPLFEHHVRNGLHLLMADRANPGTLVEFPRLFTDNSLVHRKLKKVADPMVRHFWEEERKKTSDYHKSEMLGYVTSKFDRFIGDAAMRGIIGQRRSSFDFREVMDQGRILLVNLAKGKLGEINLNLLGMLIVAKLQSAAMSRTDLPVEERKDFYLYVDEFQNIATESFAALLSEARKYRLNLVVTNQYIAQVPREISQAVFGNVGTMIAFRVGMGDAEMLEERFVPVFGSRDLINLPNFNAYVSMLVKGQVVRQFSMRSLPDETLEDEALAKRIIAQSRKRYSQLREQVDRQVAQQFGEDAGTVLDEAEIASLLSDSMATEE